MQTSGKRVAAAKKFRKAHSVHGQGVIEYAGAIVVAAVLISLAMFVVPPNVANMMNDITSSAGTAFLSHLPGGS